MQRPMARRHPLHFLVTLILLLTIVACSTNSEQKTINVTPTANPSQLVPFDLGIPTQALQSPVTGNVPDDTVLHTIVTFKPNEQTLNDLDKGQSSKDEQIDLEQKANELGITDEQFQKIKDFFGVSAISIQLNKLHTSMTLDIKASSAAQLLKTKFVYHEFAKRKFYAPSTQIMLPRVIADHIESIEGLDNYSHDPKASLHNAALQPLTTQHKQQVKAQCLGDVTDVILPQHLKQAYGFDQFYDRNWTGKGMTIILPEFEAYDPVDMETYFQCMGFRGTLTNVDVGPAPTEIGAEATLDIQMIAGLAPDANIVVYQAANPRWSGFHEVFNRILEDNSKPKAAQIVSLSWGAPEPYISSSVHKMISNDIALLTRAAHMTVFVASGDCGAFSTENYPDRPAVDFPSASTMAVGVGGTQMNLDANEQPVDETVWSMKPTGSSCKNSWGSGGGVSTIVKQPKWQAGTGVKNKYSTGYRQVPDVAAVSHKLIMYFQGEWLYTGGTSAATPIWAAAYSLVNQGLLDTTNYYVYGPSSIYVVARTSKNLQPFHDVQKGDNLYYPATAGWDYGTGLGSPNMKDLYQTYVALIKAQK